MLLTRIIRRNRATSILLMFGFGLLLLVYYNLIWTQSGLHSNVDISKFVSNDNEQVCQQPKLKLYPDQQFKDFFADIEEPKCAEEDWLYTHNGTIRFTLNAVRKYGKFQCEIRPLVRDTDLKTSLGKAQPIQDGDPITSDFFQADCTGINNTKYQNYHAAIFPSAKPTGRPGPHALDLNILVFGFDSVSHLTWQRKLPMTYRYLLHVLKAVVLRGYNVVGDGTPAALLPILTGKTEEELPNADRGRGSDAKPVDGHSWLWRELGNTGYVTQFAEDGASYSTFNYRMMGFTKQPTDHYMRTYYLEMESSKVARDNLYKTGHSYCLGSKMRHSLMFDWIYDLYRAYPTRRKFTFAFHNQLSHDDNGPLSIADEDFRNLLKRMNDEGYFDKTLLLVMSDHGARFQRLRNTVQGNFEERNPFFSVRVPPWFQEKYPEQYAALLENGQRLTTPFDIYETLRSVLDFRPPKQGSLGYRGISLFSRIPKERTCANAAISHHWCACLKRQQIPNDDVIVGRCGQEFVIFLNSVLPSFLCYRLRIGEIFRAFKFQTNPVFTNSLSGEEQDEFYQLSVSTQPGNARFEFTVKYSKVEDKVYVNAHSMSRTNMYGSSSACVAESYPNLRPYCVCKH